MKKRLRKYFVTIMFVLFCAIMLQPAKAEAVTFEEIPLSVLKWQQKMKRLLLRMIMLDYTEMKRWQFR